MYIRQTRTANKITGEAYFTFRLVRGERIGGRVRQITVLNLGRNDRGRDAHYWAPPAQIPACAIHALGSYLGCLTAKRSHGHG